MPAPSTGLTRITISSPQRRVDVALPDAVPVAELLPELLQHAGEALADDGEQHGGWVLRRADGSALAPDAGLAAAEVRDGAVLHLTPARADWPELEYDDVVEAIAAGARRYGIGWSTNATRICGLVVSGAAFGAGLYALLASGPQWTVQGWTGLGIAAALLLAGAVASRAYAEATVGATLAAFALPYAFAGGLVALGEQALLTQLGAPHLLVGATALVVCALLAAIGVGHGLRVFVAGTTVGLLAALGAGLTSLTITAGAAAVVLTVLVTGVAGAPLIAIRLGKLPMPVVTLPSDITDDGRSLAPPPDRARVLAAVARSDEILTGMLIGSAVAAVAAAVILANGGTAARLLIAVSAAALLLRARLFVTVRQRSALLAAGAAELVILAIAAVPAGVAPAVTLAAGGLMIAAAGARYARQAPTPYVGRAADLLDGLCVVSVIPIACAVLDLYARMRGLAG